MKTLAPLRDILPSAPRVLVGLAVAVLAVHSLPAAAAHIECITANTVVTESIGATTVDLSATGAETKNQTVTLNLEIYSDAEAEDAPVTCGAITCNGFDGASVEIWWKCDRNAPWGQMEDTATFTAAGVEGRVLTAGCFIRLRLIGGTGDSCMYLGITGQGFNSTKEVQDGVSSGPFVTTFD